MQVTTKAFFGRLEENRQKCQFCSIQGFFTELAQLNAQFIIGFMARENKHFSASVVAPHFINGPLGIPEQLVMEKNS